jgi:hypothetical protein
MDKEKLAKKHADVIGDMEAENAEIKKIKEKELLDEATK